MAHGDACWTPQVGELLLSTQPGGLPGGDSIAQAAEEGADRPDEGLEFTAAVEHVGSHSDCSPAVARMALRVAGAVDCGKIDPATVGRATLWARARSELVVSQEKTMHHSRMHFREEVGGGTPLDEHKHFMHRMQAPAARGDYELQGDDGEYLAVHNCAGGGCVDHEWRQACCVKTGLSVTYLVKNVAKFYDAHLYLYKLVLRPLIPDGGPEADVGDMVSRLKDQGLPRCAIREQPPEGMRMYVDFEHEKQHFHGMLQPLHGQFSLLAYGEVAMAVGDGWQLCPYFMRAAAHPEDLVGFSLPPPCGGLIVETAVRALQQLLDHNLSRMAEQKQTATSELLELSYYIVTLCDTPEDEVDAVMMQPRLAHLLLVTLKRGYVNILRPAGYAVVAAVATGLGMDTSDVEVYAGMEPPPPENGKVCTIVLLGNVVPFTIVHGQDANVSLDDVAEQMAEQSYTNPSGPGAEVELGFTWDRADLPTKDAVVVMTGEEKAGIQLPLGMAASKRLFRDAVMPQAKVEISLAELGDILALQSRDSALLFINDTCKVVKSAAELKTLLHSLTQPQRFVADRASRNVQTAARVLRGQGNASLVAAAASVVAVIRSDPKHVDEFQRVKEMLDDYLVADFITAYLSCRLRLELAEAGADPEEYGLPLATRALMSFSTARFDVDDNLTEIVPGSIQPPMPHHPAYFATFDLSRRDIGHSLGVALALMLKEGLHVARAALGLHTSFIVWFLDDCYPFNLADALLRQHGKLGPPEAQEWAARVVKTGQTYFANCGLQSRVVQGARQTALASHDFAEKRMLLITWNDHFHQLGVDLVNKMLLNAEVTLGHRLIANAKMTLLHTDTPCLETFD